MRAVHAAAVAAAALACAHMTRDRHKAEIHHDLGAEALRAGRSPDALREFDAALENMLYKEPYVARCNKGLALYRMGRKDEGLAQLRATLQMAPTFCKGRRELGRILLDEGKPKEAVEELSSYVRWCERVPDAHLQLGLARMRAGDVAGAKESFERCRDLGSGTADGEECRRSLSLLE